MARRKARELAFQTLFQAQRGAHSLWDVWHDVRVSAAEQIEEEDGAVYGDPLDHESLEFAQHLLQQFDDHQEEVDEVLTSNLKGWTFSQMSQTDVTILRLAVSEWQYLADIPAEVTIDVAVRIAKKFGGEESGRFVNGVLARLVNVDPVADAVLETPTGNDEAMSGGLDMNGANNVLENLEAAEGEDSSSTTPVDNNLDNNLDNNSDSSADNSVGNSRAQTRTTDDNTVDNTADDATVKDIVNEDTVDNDTVNDDTVDDTVVLS